MSFPSKPFVLTAFAVVMSALPAFTQINMQFVQGVVTDPDGKVVAGAVVAFDTDEAAKGVYVGVDGIADVGHAEGKKHTEAKSDKKGHYIVNMLPGVYTVTVTVDGKVRAFLRGYEVVRIGSNDPLDFKLKGGTVTTTTVPAAGGTKANKEAADKAAKDREGALAKDKALHDVYNAGKAAMDAKQWDEAITQLTKASEMGPTQQIVWGALADAYVGSAKAAKGADAGPIYDKAFAAFEKVLTLTPDDAATYNNYALALAADKRLDDATAKMAKAVELDPAGAGRYHYNLGAILMDYNQTDRALEEFKKSFTADPNFAEAYFYYGSTLLSKATMDPTGTKMIAPPGTVEALRKYLQLKPDGPNSESAKQLLAALGSSGQR